MNARILFASSLLACSLGCAANDPAERPLTDIDYATALAGRTYYDLAEEVCKQVESDPKISAEEKASVPFVIAGMKLTQAQNESDVKKSRALIEEGVKLIDGFLSAHGNHPRAEEARATRGLLKTRLAQLLNAAMQQSNDPGEKSSLQQEIGGLYEDVEKSYRERIGQLKDKKEKEDPVKPETEDALMTNWLELPRTLLDHARNGGVDEEKKKKLLNEAIAQLADFEMDYGDRQMMYDGYCIEGQCFFELDDSQKGEEYLKRTTSLVDKLVEAHLTPNEYHWGIIRNGYIALARAYMKHGRAADAVTQIDEYLAKHKDVVKTEPGYYMRILKGDALVQAGQRERAIAIGKQIIDECGAETKWGYIAKDRIAGWISAPAGGGGGAKVAANDLLIQVASFYERGKYYDALQSARQCIEAATPAEKLTLIVPAWFKMGECFQALKRNYEAASAYAKVCELDDPKREKSLWPKACMRVVGAYTQEYGVSGDKADDAKKDEYLTKMRQNCGDAPEALNIGYIQAEKLEGEGKIEEAAKLYLQVNPKAEAYHAALVRAGLCLYTAASRAWGKSKKDAGAKAACKTAMDEAEKPLKQAVDLLGDESKTIESLDAPTRASLLFLAQQQLALLYSHDAEGKAKDCLEMVDKIAKGLPPNDEKLGKLWQLKVGALLSLDQLDKAVDVLEEMFANYPDGMPIAIACKSVAIHLDAVTTEMMKKKGDEHTIQVNLKKVGKYYNKWLTEGTTVGLHITVQDVISVSETLYMIAKRLNGFDDTCVSFLDLKGKTIKDKEPWKQAQTVHEMLAGKVSDKDKLDVMSRLARCYSFIAENAGDWENALKQYKGIIGAFKLLDKNETIDYAVLDKNHSLLGVYLELATVYLELGKAGQKFEFDNAITAYNNVLKVTKPDSEPWWIAKYQAIYTLYARGGPSDREMAKVGVENLSKSYPNYDEGRYGLKDKFTTLQDKLK